MMTTIKTRFTYGLRGNITEKREKDGSDIGYSYDNKNQLLSTDYGSYEVALTYDEVGNIVEVDDGLIVEQFLYNELNQLVQFKQGNKLVGYHYDGYGNLIKLVYPDNSEVEYLTFDVSSKVHLGGGRNGTAQFYGGVEAIIAVASGETTLESTSSGVTAGLEIKGYAYGYGEKVSYGCYETENNVFKCEAEIGKVNLFGGSAKLYFVIDTTYEPREEEIKRANEFILDYNNWMNIFDNSGTWYYPYNER